MRAGPMPYTPRFRAGDFRRNGLQFLLPNEDGQVILYTYIRKNACSAFKDMMSAKRSENLGKPGLGGIKEFRWSKRIKHWDHAIFVYRDPFDRLVSAFVNKFIERSGHRDIFDNFWEVSGQRPETATFRDFVQYAAAPFHRLDPHVWPQKAHLLSIDYTLAIEIGDLSRVMAARFPSLAAFFRHKVNETAGQGAFHGDLSDVPAQDIKGCSKANFERLRPNVEAIYHQDVQMIRDIERGFTPENSADRQT